MTEKFYFKYEVHLHTCGCSKCGVSTGTEMVEAAFEKGYAGVVFTNHFYRGNNCVDKTQSWERFAAAYRDDYLLAKEAGDRLGVDVLFGIEENYWGGHEALLYGLSPEDIINAPELADISLPGLAEFTRSHGGVIICAHPFRDRAYVVEPYIQPDMSCFDGVEVYNLFNSVETNRMAAEFAKRTGTRVISGGDVHNRVNFGKTGLAVDRRLGSSAELAKALLAGDYRLIIGNELYSQSDAVELVVNGAEVG